MEFAKVLGIVNQDLQKLLVIVSERSTLCPWENIEVKGMSFFVVVLVKKQKNNYISDLRD